MVSTIGVIPTMRLIESGVVQIHDRAATIGALNMATSPHLTYDLRFTEIAAHTVDETVRRHVDGLRLPGASGKTTRRLKDLLNERVVKTIPSKIGRLDDTVTELRDRRDVLRTAVEARLTREGIVSPGAFHIEAKGAVSESVRVETDLGERLGLPVAELHEHIGKALLDIAATNLELGFMDDLRAVGTANEAQAAIMRVKLQSLAENSGNAGAQLTRLLEISGLPDINSALRNGSLNIPRFLDACCSDEAREFRRWIRTADMISEHELRKQLHPLRIKAQSWQYKAVMLVVGTLLSPLASLGVGAADAALGKLLSVPGPVVFLRRKIGKALGT